MKKNYHNEKMETASRAEIESLQAKRLRAVADHVYRSNPIYRKLFDARGVKPEDIRGLEDVSKLPTTNKNILRESYPLGLSCVPRREVAEMHMSSGSTGTPVIMPYTTADLSQWAECMARCYYMAGINQGDVIQITPSFGLFNGGFGFYHGARMAGLFIIPTGAGNTPRQIRLMKDFNVRALMGVVSYGIRIMEILEEQKTDLPDLKIGIFGAETFSNSMRKKIEGGLGIETFDIYGMTETGGVGTTGMDCPAHEGIHVWEDQYITEVVDSQTGKPLPDGSTGEVVLTSLTRSAIPVIRFRTRDISWIQSREKCICGRTHIRIGRITGRLDVGVGEVQLEAGQFNGKNVVVDPVVQGLQVDRQPVPPEPSDFVGQDPDDLRPVGRAPQQPAGDCR